MIGPCPSRAASNLFVSYDKCIASHGGWCSHSISGTRFRRTSSFGYHFRIKYHFHFRNIAIDLVHFRFQLGVTDSRGLICRGWTDLSGSLNFLTKASYSRQDAVCKHFRQTSNIYQLVQQTWCRLKLKTKSSNNGVYFNLYISTIFINLAFQWVISSYYTNNLLNYCETHKFYWLIKERGRIFNT